MPGESFRFIHASDFHLEAPLGDLDAVPSHLREAMADAPRRAAKAVFEAALADNIDFLVLSGDLLSPQSAGPHGMSLLLDYFEKLNSKKTPVFWVAGLADDPQKWPDAAPLPPNVTLFPKNRVVAIPVERAGRTICVVVGRSSEGRSALHVPSYRVEPTEEYTVAIGYGASDADALAEGRFEYWALGGEHNRKAMEGGAEGGAFYCGSPQGRSLCEPGPHGYTVVDVDADQTTRVHSIECDAFRYCQVEIDASEIAAVGGIRNLLGERITRLQHENGGRHLLIGWDISITSGENLHALGDSEALLAWLRREFGSGTPSAWTASLVIRPPKHYPKSWKDEDTILGDFLRASEKFSKAGQRELNLAPYTEEHGSIRSPTAALLADVSPSAREAILDQATLLGVELLRGGKPNLVSS
ncbi:metallophosphoesterase family protein [Novipirellula artificiosorum]|uniref:Putative metallophosphoesterase YhaO n=1 Tax=Novipirellula artificiosorum TaxID=2528016 RepID=A0A5C6DVR4_9BACT|nr:DNA repair exonuclease [Novipirellula artificiosorum]TWU40445.1 putative metallophosphoesterase YhaO [Novipirellula artificiosorum]